MPRLSAIMRPEVPRRVDLSSALLVAPYVLRECSLHPTFLVLLVLLHFFPLVFGLFSSLFFFVFFSSFSFVPMRNTRDVHGRVRRLCRLYFTLCPVCKRIISSLIFGEKGENALFLSSPSVFPCVLPSLSLSLSGKRTRDQTLERKSETGSRKDGQDELKGAAG